MRRNQLITTTALVAACAAPATAAAQGQDLRSPDTRDAAAAAAAEAQAYQDLRSPDARDAGRTSHDRPTQDLRSPDARDVGRSPVEIPTPVVEVREVPASGFDWGDAGVGAAGIVALFSIAVGGVLLLGGRRRRRGFHAPAH
ncbi:MAG TPA: hypothetical protein VH683_01765 [Thermoleophilaceae bacterium]|jgi:hypothetical protein